jgi:hypothetical protein
MPQGKKSPLHPRVAGGCWSLCLAVPGERRSPGNYGGIPAFSIPFLSHPSPLDLHLDPGLKAHVLTSYSHRQLHEGGDRGVRGEKGQALADGGGKDFPHKLPFPSAFTMGLSGLNKQKLSTQR